MAAVAPAADGMYMCIAAALDPQNPKSFEEVRYDDYLRAYQTTGRAPAPVPQLPADDGQRAAMGLPPLFKPYNTANPGGLGGSTSGGSLLTRTPTVIIDPEPPRPRVESPAALPLMQEFVEVAAMGTAGERLQSISAMNEFSFFSFEELRYHAYARGGKDPMPSVKMAQWSNRTAPVASIVPITFTTDDALQSIVAREEFEKHSPEELRVAFLLSGRELTSAEIIQLASPLLPPPTPPENPTPVPGAPGGAIVPAVVAPPGTLPLPAPGFAAPLAIAPSTSAFGAPSQTPKFTFGIR